MPHHTDKTDADTLPDPELNPLLNPLLAAHLGRWAEVYFTSPPEKRDQAVSELLRELEQTSSASLASVAVINERVNKKSAAGEEAELSPAAASLRCGGCAHKNSAMQRFCGRCGAPLQSSPEAYPQQIAEDFESWSEPEPSLGGSMTEYLIEPELRSNPSRNHDDALAPALPLPEKTLPHLAVESEPVLYRSRRYPSVVLGMVVALFLAVLLYITWRDAKSISGAAGTQSAASRASAPVAAPVASEQPGTSLGALPGGEPPASPVRSESQPSAAGGKNQPAGSPATSRATTMASRSSDESDSVELVTAEKYLNGTQAMPRDSGEAARWLWKAVGKGNLAATMALSDLYLRGDGVPKSCDQARLLLEAAARKGGAVATERLRNLQAFGCQ